ncbi:MAG: zinc ribbon domain-containing protein [Ruminococcus sp.]|nr:zinc ribbon domain-containing protein [Ruminococcus sp.]
MGFLDKIYGMAEKVGDTFEKGAKNVSDSSKKFADKTRLNKEIKQTESEINAVYMQMGKKCFELNANEPTAEFADMVNDINTKLAKIETLKNEINALEDKLPCPGCGESITKGSKFCAKCGADVSGLFPVVQAAPIAPTGKSCPACGTVAADGQKFCEKCGTAIEAAEAKTEEPAKEEVKEVVAASAAAGDGWVSAQETAEEIQETVEEVQETVEESAAPAEKACPACGTTAADGQKFCEKCGTKLGE